MKLHPTSKRELKHIAIGVCCFLAVMLAVFFVVGLVTKKTFLTPRVLFCALLSSGYAVLNFYFLALSAQKAVASGSDAALILRRTALLRKAGIFLVLVIGVVVSGSTLPAIVALAVPLLFPRLTIFAMQILGMYNPKETASGKEESSSDGN